jgi:hypothetical protein
MISINNRLNFAGKTGLAIKTWRDGWITVIHNVKKIYYTLGYAFFLVAIGASKEY